MAVGTHDARVDERRAHARAAVLRRVAQRVVGLEKVGPVGLGDEEVRERAHELRDRAAGRVDLDRNRDRVAVVLDEEEDRQLEIARRRERFPELPLRGLAFAARDVDDLVAVEGAVLRELGDPAHPPARLRGADGVQELHCRARGLGNDVVLLVAPVGRHLAPGRGRIVLRADRLEKHLVGGYTQLEDQRAVAVVAVEPVVAGLEDHPGRGRDGLVAYAVDLKVDLVLPLELDFLVVDAAGQVDVAVGGDERAAVEPVGVVGADLGRHGRGEYTKGRARTA